MIQSNFKLQTRHKHEHISSSELQCLWPYAKKTRAGKELRLGQRHPSKSTIDSPTDSKERAELRVE